MVIILLVKGPGPLRVSSNPAAAMAAYKELNLRRKMVLNFMVSVKSAIIKELDDRNVRAGAMVKAEHDATTHKAKSTRKEFILMIPARQKAVGNCCK